MKKTIAAVLSVMMIVMTLISGFCVSAAITDSPSDIHYEVLRGYSNDHGSYSFDKNKIVLNGRGVVSTAEKIVWNPDTITGECGIVFTVTYNETYASLGDACQDYRFALALMDSQSFQGNAEGNGLGVEYRLNNAGGNIQGRGLYYQGGTDLNIKYPERNNGSAFGSAQAGKSIKAKISRSTDGKWHIYFDSNSDFIIDKELATFDPNSTWEINNGSAPYFPTNLFSGGEAYLVFGAYGLKGMNVSVSIDSLYGGMTISEPKAGTALDGAYKAAGEFTMFLNMENTHLVKTSSAWAQIADSGAINNKALICNTKADNVNGDGITVKFAVPKEGDYYFWGRVAYLDNTGNSLFYRFDNGAEYIWDMPDEDASTAACYQSWHYFYMTHRKTGTYTDPAKYGTYTIENGEWRHAPNVIHLTEGVHELKISGREAGMMLDELVITSYDITEYDPNACEGNNHLLDTCKFCGTEWKHYYKDGYAINGTTAETTFKATYANAKTWLCPYEEMIPAENEDNTDDGAGTVTPPPGGNETTGTTDSSQQTTAPEQDSKKPTDTTAATEENTSATVEAPEEEKKGCSGSFAILSLMGMVGMGAMLALRGKKEN